MSGVYDYAPRFRVRQLVSATDKLGIGLTTIWSGYHYWLEGKTLQFYGPQNGLEAFVSENVTYEVISWSTVFIVIRVVGGSQVDIEINASADFGEVAFAPVSYGDVCLKPKLTKDQKTRIFNNWASQYKKPPPAAQLASGYTYDAVTGLFVGDVPAEADVRDGVDFGGGTLTGTLDLPPEGVVTIGYEYDNGTKTGTFAALHPAGIINPRPSPHPSKLVGVRHG